MRKKNYKGRCEKRVFSKCKDVCKTYDPIQLAYAQVLQNDKEISAFECNVPLDGTEYTTDFLCTTAGNGLMVRECVMRKHIMKPLTVRLLDESREYWLRRGVADWGIVTDA